MSLDSPESPESFGHARRPNDNFDSTATALACNAKFLRTFEIESSDPLVNFGRVSLDWAYLKLQEELGELISAHLRRTARSRKGMVGSTAAMADEFADVYGYLLIAAAQSGIDIDRELERKWGGHLRNMPQEELDLGIE